jgi:hypothetical protein
MRKGLAFVGAVAVGRRWVLRWEEAVKGTPAGKVRMASQAGGGGDQLLLYGLVEAGDDGEAAVVEESEG